MGVSQRSSILLKQNEVSNLKSHVRSYNYWFMSTKLPFRSCTIYIHPFVCQYSKNAPCPTAFLPNDGFPRASPHAWETSSLTFFPIWWRVLLTTIPIKWTPNLAFFNMKPRKINTEAYRHQDGYSIYVLSRHLNKRSSDQISHPSLLLEIWQDSPQKHPATTDETPVPSALVPLGGCLPHAHQIRTIEI